MIMKHYIVAVFNALTSKEFSYSQNWHKMKQICVFDIVSIIQGGPKVAILYTIYCIPTFDPPCMFKSEISSLTQC